MSSSTLDRIIEIIVVPDGFEISIDGRTQRVDPLVMKLFLYLYEHKDDVVSRQTLSEEV